jgi:Fic family protein
VRPPFEITSRAAGLLSAIERILGKYEGSLTAPPGPVLRRSLKVRTIHASVAIEGNTLTEEQVTAVLEGKRVIAPRRDLLEVGNAIACYDRLPTWKPGSPRHFLAAHKVMMKELVDRPGAWRTRGVGIAKGNVISHVAPPASRVPGLVGSLLEWVRKDEEVPAPVRAAVCHYELEFIHPFQDGNGRMGRLWHSLILSRYHPAFAHAPLESVVKERQAEYYEVLGRCDKAGKSTEFVEFALQATLEALETVTSSADRRMTSPERIEEARTGFANKWFSRKDYLALFPLLSPATASRDLKAAVDAGSIEREGDKATSRYRFAR